MMMSLTLQTAVVALIVLTCAVYVSWTLMPRAWRLALQRRWTGQEPAAASGCGSCGSCGSLPSSAAPKPGIAATEVAVIRWQPRRPSTGESPKAD